MNKYLIEILKIQSSVILPGLGALMVPSQKTGKIVFNPHLKFNDGSLANYIADKEGIDKQEAQNQIAKFVREIEAELGKGNTYDVYEFGKFFKNKDGHVDFEMAGNEPPETKKADGKSKETKAATPAPTAEKPEKKEEPKKKKPAEKKKTAEPAKKTVAPKKATEKKKAEPKEKKEDKQAKNTFVPAEEVTKEEKSKAKKETKPAEKKEESKEKKEEPKAEPKKDEKPKENKVVAATTPPKEEKKPVETEKKAEPAQKEKTVAAATTPKQSEPEKKPAAKDEKPKAAATKKTVVKKEEKKEKKKRRIWPWILLLLLIGLGVTGYFMKDQLMGYFGGDHDQEVTDSTHADDGHDEDNENHEDIELVDDDMYDTMEEDTLGMVDGEAADVIPEEEYPEEEPAPVITDSGTGGNYHLIGNSFGERSNADRYVQKMQEKGYPAKVLGQFDDLYLVSLKSYDSRSSANDGRSSVSGDAPSAWIFKYPK